MLADMWGGMPGMGHSGAARAGMENFTKTAAYEWGHSGVRVNAVAPGWIASSGMDTYPESMKNMIRNLKDHVPLQRIGTESEVASVIVFLLTPGANFISGNTIRIDGAASQGTRAWTLGKPIIQPSPTTASTAPICPTCFQGVTRCLSSSRKSTFTAKASRRTARPCLPPSPASATWSRRCWTRPMRPRPSSPSAVVSCCRANAYNLLLDPGAPFLELSSLAGYKLHDDKDGSMAGGGIIAGIGYIAGVRSLVIANNSAIKGGTISPTGLKKSLRLQQIAFENKLPVVTLAESGGANLNYAADIFVEGARGFANQARMSAMGLPQITVVHGSSTAGGAYQPGLSDYVVVVRGKAKMFLAGPPLLKAATGEVATDEATGRRRDACPGRRHRRNTWPRTMPMACAWPARSSACCRVERATAGAPGQELARAAVPSRGAARHSPGRCQETL